MDRESTTPVALSRVHFPVSPSGRDAELVSGSRDARFTATIVDLSIRGQQVMSRFPVSSVVDWVAARSSSPADGVTISGGEPFDQPEGLQSLLLELQKMPSLCNLDILVYSGYTLSRIKRRHQRILDLLDALISGP